MTTPERFIEQATELIRRVREDPSKAGDIVRSAASSASLRRQRRRRRRRRAVIKVAKTAGAMALSAVVIILGMLVSGQLLGASGSEGLLATSVMVLVSWLAIVLWARRSATPSLIAKAELPQLPMHTEAWLEQQRRSLPSDAQRQLDTITQRLEALSPQLRTLDPQTSVASEFRRLVGEELPELIKGYQKVPRTLQAQPLHGGPSPDRQLVAGLTTIDEEIARMHARLATEDLHALATQQRFLETKYKRDDDDL